MRAMLLGAVLAVASPMHAQFCAPVFPLPSGQPALFFPPACLGVVPLPVLGVAGNPGFMLASVAPAPVPPGVPTFLMLGILGPAVPLPAGLLDPAFGAPGLLTVSLVSPAIVLPAGPALPLGIPVAVPLPPTAAVAGLDLAVQTLILMPGGLLGLTAATGITV